MSSSVLIAVAVIAVVAYGLSHLLRSAQADEAKWFAAILQSTDEELSDRSLPAIARDRSRMGKIWLDTENRSGVTRTWITNGLAKEQLGRLNAAMDTAARRHHEDAAVQKAAQS